MRVVRGRERGGHEFLMDESNSPSHAVQRVDLSMLTALFLTHRYAGCAHPRDEIYNTLASTQLHPYACLRPVKRVRIRLSPLQNPDFLTSMVVFVPYTSAGAGGHSTLRNSSSVVVL
jgi:hypothetical protein